MICKIKNQLSNTILQEKISNLQKEIEKSICSSLPNAFWDRKTHIIDLPYENNFDERNIPTKARPTQMNNEVLNHCKKKIGELINKKLICKSNYLWSCSAFYVNKNAKIERGRPRLVINYKPLNDALKWIRYPIPKKKDLLSRLHNANFFSKFDMKSGFWQI